MNGVQELTALTELSTMQIVIIILTVYAVISLLIAAFMGCNEELERIKEQIEQDDEWF